MEFTKKQVRAAAERAEIGEDDESRLLLHYSGRGMYGRDCIAIVGSLSHVVGFLWELLDHDIIAVRDHIDGGRDSMGLGTVYYWSNLKVEGSE